MNASHVPRRACGRERDVEWGDDMPDEQTAPSVETLWADIEADTSSREDSYERAHAFERIGRVCREQGDDLGAQRAEWLKMAFYVELKPRQMNHERDLARERVRAPFAPEHLFAAIPDDALAELRSQLEVSTNPIHRARYADILW